MTSVATPDRNFAPKMMRKKILKILLASPPEKPTLPQILADNPDGGGPVDLMVAEQNARRALFKKRSPDELWSDMEKAFAKQNIRLQRLGGVAGFSSNGGTLRARPIQR